MNIWEEDCVLAEVGSSGLDCAWEDCEPCCDCAPVCAMYRLQCALWISPAYTDPSCGTDVEASGHREYNCHCRVAEYGLCLRHVGGDFLREEQGISCGRCWS